MTLPPLFCIGILESVAIRGGAQSAVVKEILIKFDEKITMASKSTGRANDVAVVPKREIKAALET